MSLNRALAMQPKVPAHIHARFLRVLERAQVSIPSPLAVAITVLEKKLHLKRTPVNLKSR